MSQLRIGVIGCGAIGQDHIRRINQVIQGAYVTAVSDVYVEGGQKVALEWNAAFFANGEELIASDLVDAIIVTTLDEYHEQYVLAAIANDKFVFCEKPLAPTADACRRIMDAEIAGGRQLVQVGFMRRYDTGYRQLKEIVDNKTFGEPLVLHCAHRNGVITPNYITPMLITNCAVHEIDVLRWLLGEDYTSCQIVLGKKTSKSLDKLHDPIIVMLETTSGVRIDIEVFMNCQYGYDIRCEMVCEEASVSLPTPTSPFILNAGKRYNSVSDDWKERFIQAYDVEFQEWVNAVKQNRVEGPSAWDGYACALTATSCVKALEENSIVPIIMDTKPDFY